jgi:hypothetical protein
MKRVALTGGFFTLYLRNLNEDISISFRINKRITNGEGMIVYAAKNGYLSERLAFILAIITKQVRNLTDLCL